MRERLRHFGGELIVDSNGSGTKVYAISTFADTPLMAQKQHRASCSVNPNVWMNANRVFGSVTFEISWLLKNSRARNSPKKLCIGLPYKRRSWFSRHFLSPKFSLF